MCMLMQDIFPGRILNFIFGPSDIFWTGTAAKNTCTTINVLPSNIHRYHVVDGEGLVRSGQKREKGLPVPPPPGSWSRRFNTYIKMSLTQSARHGCNVFFMFISRPRKRGPTWPRRERRTGGPRTTNSLASWISG